MTQGETDRVHLAYHLKCFGGCGRIEIENQKRPDLALARHTRETHHPATLVGVPVTSDCDDKRG